MSADEQSGAGRREVAYRVFAAEYDDADYQYTENEADERAPNYVVTPTGARVNRLFVVGVLTEVERVNEEMLRGRIVDPTGAFVVYAGQYQPDALTALERLTPPAFVAITGKARTFQPEDAETIYTSVRPESINEVDADTRGRWTVGAARHTLDRVATFADALEREEGSEELTAALEADGVDHGLAAGISQAIDHYATSPAYLEAIQEMAIEAAEVVAGDREEVAPLDLAPDEGGSAEVDLDAETGLDGVGGGTGGASPAADASANASEGVPSEPSEVSSQPSEVSSEPSTETGTTRNDLEETVTTEDDLGETASTTGTPDDAEAGGASNEVEEPTATTDEMYEFDEDEREEIESEYGTDFSTGADIEEAGESDLETSETVDRTAGEAESDAGAEGIEPAATDAGTETGTGDLPGESEPADESASTDEQASADEPDPDVDLEDAVVEVMRDLDSGDGADRNTVIERVSEEYGAAPADVEDAIQDALMSGTCYEPGDGLLKAI
jgi:RPA family protein